MSKVKIIRNLLVLSSVFLITFSSIPSFAFDCWIGGRMAYYPWSGAYDYTWDVYQVDSLGQCMSIGADYSREYCNMPEVIVYAQDEEGRDIDSSITCQAQP